MSEKRYEIRTNIDGEHWLFDNKYDKAMMISKIRATLLVVCNRLNEQQATITHLEKVFGENFAKRRLLEQDNLVLRNENEQLRKRCFELEKDYVIETSDISDRIYIDDEIRELKQKYGVTDE